jgi:putative FmdB family regulatory protein
VPTYQYACTSCDERLEVVQKFSDDPLTECPSCASRLRKVFSPVGVVFKGSGFYRTDSRKDGAAKEGAAKTGAAGADGSSSSGGGGKDAASTSTGSDAKPAKAEGAKKSSGSESKVA